jgi:hypothetical protein
MYGMYLRFKDESFQIVKHPFPFLLGQVSVGQVL